MVHIESGHQTHIWLDARRMTDAAHAPAGSYKSRQLDRCISCGRNFSPNMLGVSSGLKAAAVGSMQCCYLASKCAPWHTCHPLSRLDMRVRVLQKQSTKVETALGTGVGDLEAPPTEDLQSIGESQAFAGTYAATMRSERAQNR
eukprot:5367674-Amphidinium_carterae.1